MKHYMIISLLALSLSSCKKGLDNVEYESKVYFPLSGLAEIQPLVGASTYELTVYKSGINSDQEAFVELFIDETALGEYKTSDEHALLLPKELYSLDPLQVRFSKDENEKTVNIRLTNIDETFTGKNFILPISLRSSNEDLILDHKKTSLLKLSNYKNQYAGKYKVSSLFYPQSKDEDVQTADLTSLEATTISSNVFRISSHINNMDLWVEVNGDKATVREANNSHSFLVEDLGSKAIGNFDTTYQRFNGLFDLWFSYQLNNQTYECKMQLIFDL